MNRLALRRSGEVTRFEPEAVAERDAKADALIDYALRVKDFSLLEEAVDAKIENQREFVGWWDANIVPLAGPGRGRKPGHDPRRLSRAVAEAQTKLTHQQVSRWRRWIKKPDEYRDRLCRPTIAKAMGEAAMSELRGASGTGENEWFTPAEHIERARQVLGGIDLDPASNAQANKVVQAAEYFSKKSNGLTQEWHGRVWLNPPYAQPAIQHFADKMAAEWTSGRISAAIMLTHNYTDTAWFQTLAHAATAICFTRGRVRFVAPDGTLAAPTQGQGFFYFGGELDRFVSGFASIGFVAEVQR